MPTPADTPAQVIKAALDGFLFNAFLADAIEANLITPHSFRLQAKIDTGNHGLLFHRSFSVEEVKLWGRNNLLMSLGTAAIATNTALDAVFTKKDKASGTTDLGAARAIIYQIRCAFAHDPLTPIWKPADRFKHTYRVSVRVPLESGQIESRTIEFHPSSLRGKHLSALDFGGLGGYMGLLLFCLHQVEKHPLGKHPYVLPPDPICP
jgi:hypothetical protein